MPEHTQTHTHIQVYIHTHNKHRETHILIHTHAHAYIHTYIHTYTHTHTYTITYIHTHTYILCWNITWLTELLYSRSINLCASVLYDKYTYTFIVYKLLIRRRAFRYPKWLERCAKNLRFCDRSQLIYVFVGWFPRKKAANRPFSVTVSLTRYKKYHLRATYFSVLRFKPLGLGIESPMLPISVGCFLKTNATLRLYMSADT